MGKIAGKSATRMCLPFCSLAMKIMTLKGIRPPKEGTTLLLQRPISLIFLQMSKGHSSAEKANKSLSKPPSESPQHATHTKQRSTTPTVLEQLKTAPLHTLKPQPTST